MPSNGAKLTKTTVMITGGLLVSACATGQTSPVATLNDAVHTRALIEQASTRAARMQDRFAVEAEAARQAGNLPAAIQLAEQAITLDTNDEGARQTLAASYFAAGRFQSAADAYDDLLAMNPGADKHKFGAALSKLASGDKFQARALLAELKDDSARRGDVGLAYVLLGDLDTGASVLEQAVRSGHSDARTRQNLALAQALSGEWNAARVTAAIDLSPPEVEARVSEWAALAVSDDTAWRTASLMKIAPVPNDAGRPVQLAWSPPVEDVPVQYAAAEVADVAPQPAEVDREVPAPVVEPVAVAAAKPAPAEVDALPIVKVSVPEAAPAKLMRASVPLSVAPRAPKDEVEAQEPVKTDVEKAPAAAKAESKAKPEAEQKVDPVASLPAAGSDGSWLVQLGAYDRPEWVKENWEVLKVRNDFLQDYKATRSRTEIDGRDYYRLSIGRFESASDAKDLCVALKANGASCFVREGSFKG